MPTSAKHFLEAKAGAKANAALAAESLVVERHLATLLSNRNLRARGSALQAARAFDRLSILRNHYLLVETRFGLATAKRRSKKLPLFRDLLKAERVAKFKALPLGMRAPGINLDLLWFKICWVLGIHDVIGTITDFFGANHPNLIRSIWNAIKNRDWKKARDLIKFLLGILKSDKFEEYLIKKLGKKKARDIMKRIGAKFIPGLGWMVTAGMVLAAIIAQFIIE